MNERQNRIDNMQQVAKSSQVTWRNVTKLLRGKEYRRTAKKVTSKELGRN